MSRPLRVLQLEDSEADARLIVHALRQSGFKPTVKRVETEAEFLVHLQPFPELILADYRLPQFDAICAMRLMRERNVDVPIIVITGALGDEAAVECLKEGACDYLLKDRLARLGPAVVRALEQKQSRDESRRTLVALLESEARKTAILETAADGIISIDHRGIIESFNPMAERLFGYPADSVIGKCVSTLMPSPDREAFQGYLNNYVTTGRKKMIGYVREVDGRKNDGTTFPMELKVAEVQLGNRTIFTGVVRDITNRKQAEHEITRQTLELTRSNVELERFAYVASHDLQEPLRMIGSFTELLARRYDNQLDATANEFIAFIVDGVNRMQTLINDLLTYSRVGSKAKPFAECKIDVVIDQTLANLKALIAETGAVVTKDALPSLWADASQLGQLFQNLIGNAIKYHGEAPPRIHIAAERQGANWVFSVRDNGIGFDPVHADRIFKIFQRLHTREEYPGTGVGLAICQKIVERHAGRIWAESEPDRGSRFLFTMPATAEGNP